MCACDVATGLEIPQKVEGEKKKRVVYAKKKKVMIIILLCDVATGLEIPQKVEGEKKKRIVYAKKKKVTQSLDREPGKSLARTVSRMSLQGIGDSGNN